MEGLIGMNEKIVQFDKIVKIIEREETDIPEPSMNIVDTDYGKPYCPHDEINLFIHQRQVQCRNCRQVIDPIDFIFRLAREESNHISQIRWLRHELKNIEKQKSDLERQVGNLKAQKRKYS